MKDNIPRNPCGMKRVPYDRLLIQLLLIAPCFFIRFSLDNDVYWLIESGRYVMEHGIPTVEPLTLHEGLSFVMQQWLSAVCFAWIYDTLGFYGLMGLVLIVFVLIALIVQRLCWIVGHNEFVSYVVALLSIIVIWPFMTTRPFMISMLLFLLEIIILEKTIQTNRKSWLFFIPVISVLLINFHAALWPFMFIIAVPYIIDSFSFIFLFFNGEGYPRAKMLLAFCTALLAGFVNPYGLDSMTYLFRSYGHQSISANILEMQSPNFQTGSGLFVFIVFTVVVIVIALARPQKLRLRQGLLLLGTGFMTLSSMRNLSLFAICGIPMLAYVLRDFKPTVDSVTNLSVRRQMTFLVALLCAAGVLFGFNLSKAYQAKDYGLPKNAVGYIIESYDIKTLRLYADYNWGGYAEFRGLKPFIDARAEVFLKVNNGKEDILVDFLQMSSGEMYYTDFIDKYDLNVFLIERGDLLDIYLTEDNGFTRVFEDKDFVVFEKIPE